MATTVEESATTILCSCKQTRFDIQNPVYSELDISGLNITVASVEKSGAKSKGKARAEGLEILSNANLKLKAGVCYALVGRNGTGKSTLLKAVAEKLIPGIPIPTRISILQQTSSEATVQTQDQELNHSMAAVTLDGQLSVLEEVIDRATSRNDIQNEITVLSQAIEFPNSKLAPLRAFRQVQHQRLKKELFELDKDARLRSGTRGMAARKALLAFEKKVAAFEETMVQTDEDIDEDVAKEENQAAADLLVELQSQIEPTLIANIETKARQILIGLGFPKGNFDKPISTLSGGWRMRTNLASALLQPSDILILDEPTNFLDLLGIIWLQKYLLQLRDDTTPPTIVLVSHDREFINQVCQELILLLDHELTYFRGDLNQYEETMREKKLYLGRMKDAQDKQKAHMQQTIQQNIKQGKAAGDDNKLRQAKSRQKKLDDRMGLNVSAGGGRFKLNRDLAGFHLKARADIDIPQDEKGVNILLPEAPDLRFPGPLVSLEKVSYRYPAPKKTKNPQPLVLENIDLTIHMGDRIGILGLNGSGKTTIISLLTDVTKATTGSVNRHPRLRLGYYSQHSVEDLQLLGRTEPDLTALALMTRDVASELDEPELRGLLGSLGLPGRTASDVPLVKLSGGQLVRLALARLLWKSPQLLVLDEITTHLDFYTVTALGDALSGWNGAIVVVSHDRFLVRRVVENEKFGEGDDEDDDEEDDEQRRRVVYLLKSGNMKVLEKGVTGFEESLERRVEKLLAA